MNIKSLLIGSAAALAVVSGAQAADAIVAAEPEPMEYVRVCDAFGTGYFYIPGSETCLKISGYVRFQVDWSSFDRVGDDFAWNSATRGLVRFEAKNDTEMGVLASKITVRAWADDSSHSISAGDGMLELDEAFVTLGGFKFGYGYTYWDTGIVGETDGLANVARNNMIGYEYAADAFKVGVFIDELNYATNDRLGVEALVSGKFGAVSVALLGGYDFADEDGAVRAIVGADIGPGKLEVAGIYASGRSSYFAASEWSVAVGYEAAITDKLKITPGFQYWGTRNFNAAGDFVGNNDAWRAGVALDYAITTGLAAKVSVQYTDDESLVSQESWGGYFRLERSF